MNICKCPRRSTDQCADPDHEEHQMWAHKELSRQLRGPRAFRALCQLCKFIHGPWSLLSMLPWGIAAQRPYSQYGGLSSLDALLQTAATSTASKVGISLVKQLSVRMPLCLLCFRGHIGETRSRRGLGCLPTPVGVLITKAKIITGPRQQRDNPKFAASSA